MRSRRRSFASRNRLWSGCIGAGLIAGAIVGVHAASDIEAALFSRGLLSRSSAAPARPAPRDPLGDGFGYELAASVRLETMADCASLRPEFQAGCRKYIRDLSQERLGRAAPEDW